METLSSKILAKQAILKSLEIVYKTNSSHIGGALSIADILAVLYANILNIDPANPKDKDRDRLIYSKGHCCSILYAILAIKKNFPIEELDTYTKNGSRLLSHTTHYIEGIEISAGSLGHGLPIACGLAISSQKNKKNNSIYCIVGDGEMNEGSNWEAILFAAHHKLNNLCLIIDYNKIQSLGNTNEVLNLEPLQQKFIAFNWNTIEINGHKHDEIYTALKSIKNSSNPTVIIAHTIKGKYISFMENNLAWHYKSPNAQQYQQAIQEINKKL